MAGSVSGGLKAAKTIKERYGEDFYAGIGAKGGKRSHTGGFASEKNMCRCSYNMFRKHKKASCVGAKGGRASSRYGVKNKKNREA